MPVPIESCPCLALSILSSKKIWIEFIITKSVVCKRPPSRNRMVSWTRSPNASLFFRKFYIRTVVRTWTYTSCPVSIRLFQQLRPSCLITAMRPRTLPSIRVFLTFQTSPILIPRTTSTTLRTVPEISTITLVWTSSRTPFCLVRKESMVRFWLGTIMVFYSLFPCLIILSVFSWMPSFITCHNNTSFFFDISALWKFLGTIHIRTRIVSQDVMVLLPPSPTFTRSPVPNETSSWRAAGIRRRLSVPLPIKGIAILTLGASMATTPFSITTFPSTGTIIDAKRCPTAYDTCILSFLAFSSFPSWAWK